jgi:putative cardiolipin synthase
MLIDERYLFVGSLNLDPRSVRINAEMGLLIDSREIGRDYMEDIENGLEEAVYELDLDEEGRLRWLATIDGEQVVETKEPLTNWWRRFQASIYRVLPESQL